MSSETFTANMSFLKSITGTIKQTYQHYWSVYRSEKMLDLYQKGKISKLISKIPKFKNYEAIKIDEHPFLFFLVSSKDMETIDELMKVDYKDSILNQIDENLGINAACYGILNSEYEVVNRLRSHGANIFMPMENGNTALHFSAFHNNIEAIKFCLEAGANINSQNNDGETPIHLAIVKENLDSIKHLIESKASLTIQNNLNYFPIHEAAETNNIDIFKLLFPSLNEVRKVQTEFDVAHIAAKVSSPDILAMILNENRAYVNIIDNPKREAKPLHYAVIGRAFENIRLLGKYGAMMDSKDTNGNTPLHLAVMSKDVDTVNILNQFGADATVKNNDGYSALDLCFSELDQVMLKLFRSNAKYNEYFRNK